MSRKSKNATLRSRESIPLLLRIGLWGAIILHILVFVFFRLSAVYLPSRENPKPYVTFVSEDFLKKDAELEEYAILFDSSPLFIPTVWNSSQLIEVDFENSPPRELRGFDPKVELLSELEPESSLVEEDFRIKQPSDLLTSRFWRFFEEFGRSVEATLPFEQTTPIAEISVIDDPQKPATLMAVDLEPLRSFELPRPVTFTVRRLGDGPILGTPTLNETSGNEMLDQLVVRWLQRPDVLARLPVGYLLIRVFFW